ncbi:MAG: hypothetical protein HQ553_03570 [Chloroflexi bacterium]|nr:hypothetical protein [Chloroflexota bacterium]
MIIGGGIALIVIGLIMITTQLDFSKESKTEATIETKPSDEESTPSLEKKSEIQMELDTLISNIAEFVSNEPPAPTQIQGEDWASWQQRYSEHRDKIQSDFFNSFNTRIAGVVEKLHNLKIISADEYESVKTHYNHASTIYAARATSLIEKLNIYKARLDEMEKTFTSK